MSSVGRRGWVRRVERIRHRNLRGEGAGGRALSYLANENVFEDDHFTRRGLLTIVGFGAAGDDLMYLLTPLGRTFVDYARG
jgi:hypothetical protein